MEEYLIENELISENHHGNRKKRSTQTLVSELHDLAVEKMNKKEDVVIMALDQTKAYKIISHSILKAKLRLIGFSETAMELIDSYLDERKQFVEVNGKQSEILLVGPRSSSQGSTLSGFFYLVYTLDLPHLFHSKHHSPSEDR